jgi:hypothetical protein
MQALYPKKKVPFNANQPKKSSLINQAGLDVPGK